MMLRTHPFRVFLPLAALVLFASGAQAQVFNFEAILSGPAEAPPNASPGTGFSFVTFDTAAHTMRVQISFSGLLGTTTNAHIHSATAQPFTGTAGVATQTPTFSGFPSGVTSGTYDNTFDMSLASSYNPVFITNNGGTPASAEAALLNGVTAGRAYVNIHSSVFGGGEIRGFLVAAAPEPGSLAILTLGSIGLLARRQKK